MTDAPSPQCSPQPFTHLRPQTARAAPKLKEVEECPRNNEDSAQWASTAFFFGTLPGCAHCQFLDSHPRLSSLSLLPVLPLTTVTMTATTTTTTTFTQGNKKHSTPLPMTAAEQEVLQVRRPTTHTAHHDSVTVPMLQADHHHDQFENPFQQRPQSRHSPQRHYNVMIPAVQHWPALFIEGVQASTLFVTEKLRQLHAYRQSQKGNSSSSSKYEGLPITSRSSTTATNISSRRSTFTFGSKRQLKESGGRAMLFSGRRLSQFLLLLSLATLASVWVFVVPHTLKPYKDREVWIRYLDHTEAIKIQAPLGRTIHVADVRHVAFAQLSQGFAYQQLELGKLLLISDRFGPLPPDTEWRNWDWRFGSSTDRPILLIDPRHGKKRTPVVTFFQGCKLFFFFP